MDENNITMAIKYLDSAIITCPNIDSFYTSRAICYYLTNNYENAINDCNTAIQIYNKNIDAFYIRGLCRSKITIRNDERDSLRKIDNTDSVLLSQMVKKYKFISSEYNIDIYDYGSAIDDFTKAIELDSLFDEAYLERGKIYLLLSSYSEALSDFNKAIELIPTKANFYFERAILFKNYYMLEESLNDFDKAIELDSNNAFYYYVRGNFKFEQLMNKVAACNDFKKAELFGLVIKEIELYCH